MRSLDDSRHGRVAEVACHRVLGAAAVGPVQANRGGGHTGRRRCSVVLRHRRLHYGPRVAVLAQAGASMAQGAGGCVRDEHVGQLSLDELIVLEWSPTLAALLSVRDAS